MNEEMIEELKPCPFCGGDRLIEDYIRDGAEVRCLGHGCGATVHRFRPDAAEKARRAWNKRSAYNPNERLREAAEIGLEYVIEAANNAKDDVFENAMRDLKRIEAVLADTQPLTPLGEVKS